MSNLITNLVGKKTEGKLEMHMIDTLSVGKINTRCDLADENAEDDEDEDE